MPSQVQYLPYIANKSLLRVLSQYVGAYGGLRLGKSKHQAKRFCLDLRSGFESVYLQRYIHEREAFTRVTHQTT